MYDLNQDLKRCRNKDVRDEARRMVRDLGFIYDGVIGSGHMGFSHPDYHGTVEMSWSPSARGWRRSHRVRVAKYLGLTRWQLERRIAGQPLERVKRMQGPGREAPEVILVRYAARQGLRLSPMQARRLVSRFGSMRNARVALNGMVRAAQRNREIEEAA